MSDTPFISIIIPTYNRANYLDQTIASALAQTGVAIEVIVSDNCSTDNTREVVRKYESDPRFRYFCNEENIGMVRNWRKAVCEHARGAWFMILSDDDYLTDAAYLSDALELIASDPQVVLVYGNGFILDVSSGKMTALNLPFSGVVPGRDIFVSRGTVKPQDILLCNVIFKKDVSISLNPFTNPDNLSCDSELFLKLCVLGKVGVVSDRSVAVYRHHPKNLIKSVNRSADLAQGNMDYFVNPYVYAKGKLDQCVLDAYAKNFELRAAIMWTLYVLAQIDRARCWLVLRDVAAKVPDIYSSIRTSPFFWVKLILIAYMGLPAEFSWRKIL